MSIKHNNLLLIKATIDNRKAQLSKIISDSLEYFKETNASMEDMELRIREQVRKVTHSTVILKDTLSTFNRLA